MASAISATAGKALGMKGYPNRGIGYSKFDNNTKQQWDGYCDCCTACDDFCNCCKACWFPCVSMQDNATAVGLYADSHPDNGGCSKYIGCWTLLAFICFLGSGSLPGILFAVGGDSGATLAGAGSIFTLIGRLCFCWPNMWFRSTVMAKQFNLPVCDGMGCFVDCCCELFCWCLVMPQEVKTSKRLMTSEVDLVGQAINAVGSVIKAL